MGAKRWGLLKSTGIGACLGAVYAGFIAFKENGYPSHPTLLVDIIGQMLGGALAAGVLFLSVAAIRNWATGANSQ